MSRFISLYLTTDRESNNSFVMNLSSENKLFYLTHLYAKEMSVYGDMGNILALRYRLEKLGFTVIYQEVNQKDRMPEKNDFYFIGGGQDKEQFFIFQDLLSKKENLIKDLEIGVPMLAICGGYQLLGKKFFTGEGLEIDGIGILPVITKAPDNSVKSRCIGNILVKADLPGLENIILVGFENHSGQTYFDNTSDKESMPIGKVISGFGNNSVEKLEGCVYKNVIGTYMHGSCLPKNPELSGYLLKKALEVKAKREHSPEYSINFSQIDDSIANLAKEILIKRFSS